MGAYVRDCGFLDEHIGVRGGIDVFAGGGKCSIDLVAVQAYVVGWRTAVQCRGSPMYAGVNFL